MPSAKTLRRRQQRQRAATRRRAALSNNNSASEYEGNTTKNERKLFRNIEETEQQLKKMNMNIEALFTEIKKHKNTNQAKTNTAALKVLEIEPIYDALESRYESLINKLPHKGSTYNPNLERAMRKTANRRKNGTLKKFRPGHFTME